MKKDIKKPSVFLRKLKISDAKAIHKQINDKQIAKWTLRIPYPYKEKDALDFIRKSICDFRKRTGFAFGVILKETDGLVGIVGFHDISLKDKNAEIGDRKSVV